MFNLTIGKQRPLGGEWFNVILAIIFIIPFGFLGLILGTVSYCFCYGFVDAWEILSDTKKRCGRGYGKKDEI